MASNRGLFQKYTREKARNVGRTERNSTAKWPRLVTKKTEGGVGEETFQASSGDMLIVLKNEPAMYWENNNFEKRYPRFTGYL